MEDTETANTIMTSPAVSLSELDSNLDFSTMEGTAISGKLRVGFFSMDRACQTEMSDIISLKETTDLLAKLVQEIKLLKKDLYYTKLSLQAAYETNIQSRAVELYQRVNDGVLNLEKMNEKRINNIRLSFRTQLENAILKISNEYQQFYTGVSEQERMAHQARVLAIEQEQEEQRRARKAQQELIDMMKLQMDESSQNNEDDQNEGDGSSLSPPPAAEYIREIEELRECILGLESRVDELEESLSESNNDNRKLGSEVERAKRQLLSEQKRYGECKKEVLELQILLENERKTTKKRLDDQKADLQKRLRNELDSAQEQAKVEASRKLKELEAKQAEKLREQQLLEQRRLEELIQSKEQEKEEEAVDDSDVAVLRRIEKKQRQEIARLRKELERAKKVSDIKIGVLQKNIHALKDEMFLRISLQRQSAKVQHAAVSYSLDDQNPVAVLEPCNSPPAQRQFQLPNVVNAQAGLQLTRALTSDAINRSASIAHRPLSAPRNKAHRLSLLK